LIAWEYFPICAPTSYSSLDDFISENVSTVKEKKFLEGQAPFYGLSTFLSTNYYPLPEHLKVTVLRAKYLNHANQNKINFFEFKSEKNSFEEKKSTVNTLENLFWGDQSFYFHFIKKNKTLHVTLSIYDADISLGTVSLNLKEFFDESVSRGRSSHEATFKIKNSKDPRIVKQKEKKEKEKKEKNRSEITLRFLGF